MLGFDEKRYVGPGLEATPRKMTPFGMTASDAQLRIQGERVPCCRSNFITSVTPFQIFVTGVLKKFHYNIMRTLALSNKNTGTALARQLTQISAGNYFRESRIALRGIQKVR